MKTEREKYLKEIEEKLKLSDKLILEQIKKDVEERKKNKIVNK